MDTAERDHTAGFDTPDVMDAGRRGRLAECGSLGTADEVVEFSTHVRGRPVTCRWDGVQLSGDAPLLERLRRGGALPEPGARPGAVARAIRSAVPAPVSLEVVAVDEPTAPTQPAWSAPAPTERTPPSAVR